MTGERKPGTHLALELIMGTPDEPEPQMYQPQLFGGEHVRLADTDSWCTPEAILGPVRRFLGPEFTDPCSNDLSTVGAATSYTLADDGLAQDWRGGIWCNPPDSKPEPWMRRCSEMPARGGEALALPKGDWTTSWWSKYVRPASARCLLGGRVAFVCRGKRTVANFPSVLVYWGPRVARFRDVFESMGEVIVGAHGFAGVPPGTEEPSPCKSCDGHPEAGPLPWDPACRTGGCPDCGGSGLDPNGDLPSAPGYQP